jgi:hypothetical protein
LNVGVVDAGLDLRFKEDGTLAAGTRLVFTDLDISEPADGPIYSRLHLPAPLNGVVFLLRDESGALAVPFDVDVRPDDLSLSAVGSAATSTMGKVIGSAFTNATVRLAMAPASLVGLAGKEATEPEEPLFLEFRPGEQVLQESQKEKIAGVLRKLQDDERRVVHLSHELGGSDFAAASRRASPSRDECIELALGLRSRRGKLIAERNDAAAEARACFAAGLASRAEAARVRVRSLEREIGLAEEALDGLYAMLRPGAERLAPRRTREICLTLARARLIEVRDALAASLPSAAERIDPLPRPRFTETAGSAGGRVLLTVRTKKSR